MLMIKAVALAALVTFTATAATAHETSPVPRSPGLPYAPKNLPDRIVLTPLADPSTGMAVSFRTDVAQTTAEAQLSLAYDGPTLTYSAQTLTGQTFPISNANGDALYHQVRFTSLTPDTVYAYRVKGSAGWSEWFQFRTAAETPKPFRFLYLGDTQNFILTYGARVIRQGFHEGKVDLVVHAGDLVAQRDELDHDDEWGEWTQVGGYNYAMIPQLPATGNHEYADLILPDGSESRTLGPHWPLQFALPDNGAEGVKATTYYVDYQGVRFIILDGTAALDLGQAEPQTQWLDATLASSPATWNIVLFHQPIYTCARPNDTEALKAIWKPVFDARKVDLVLQGHDHCYSRLTDPEGREAGAQKRQSGLAQGPVYLVSVVGGKMYGLNDRADTQPDKVAEATELYQVVDVDGKVIRFRTYTASGKLYDGFDLARQADGRNLLTELDEPLLATRRCTGPDVAKNAEDLAAGTTGPDGGPCVAEVKD